MYRVYKLIFWLKKLHVWLVEGKSPFLGVMLTPTFMEALPWDSLGWWRSWIVEFRAVNCGRLGNPTTGSCVVKPIINLQLFMIYTSCFWWIWGLYFSVFFPGLLLDVERFLKNCRQVSQSKLGEEQAALQNLQSENAELHRRLEVQTNIIQISYNSFFPQSFS